MNAHLRPLATSGAHSKFREGLPPPIPTQRLQTVKQDILDLLAITDMLSFSSVTAGGWPITACMHFATVADRQLRPVIFMFSNDHTRKLKNIAADPRVSAAIFRPKALEDAHRTPYLQLQGVARHITDGAEFSIALQSNFDKVDYGHTKVMGLQDQPAIRIDVLSAVWEDPRSGHPAGFIDYGPDLASG